MPGLLGELCTSDDFRQDLLYEFNFFQSGFPAE